MNNVYNAHLLLAMVRRKVGFCDLAEEVGLNPATLRAYSRGDTEPNVTIGLGLANALGVEPHWLWMEEPSKLEQCAVPRLQAIIRKAAYQKKAASNVKPVERSC